MSHPEFSKLKIRDFFINKAHEFIRWNLNQKKCNGFNRLSANKLLKRLKI